MPADDSAAARPTVMLLAPELLARALRLDEHDIAVGRVFSGMDGAIRVELVGDGLPQGLVSATYQQHEGGRVVLKAIEPA